MSSQENRQQYQSSCACTAVTLKLTLPEAIDSYTPRRCDCDFCTQRKICYLSDPQGTLHINAEQTLVALTQGSEQAKFWQCSECKSVVAVTCQYPQVLRGAVNARLFAPPAMLENAQTVSPKQLNPTQKSQRWQQVWMHVHMAGLIPR